MLNFYRYLHICICIRCDFRTLRTESCSKMPEFENDINLEMSYSISNTRTHKCQLRNREKIHIDNLQYSFEAIWKLRCKYKYLKRAQTLI